MDEERELAYGTTLRAFGLEDTPNAQEMLEVFLNALRIHEDRDRRYGDGWKRRGWLGNVADIIRKGERVRSMFWDSTEYDIVDDPDDLFDLINYAAFAIRNSWRGNRTGSE
jgi:hypothetical protein